MSLANRLEDVELDLDEDETVLDRVFLEVDVWRVIVFGFILVVGTSSMVSMLVFLYVFETELIASGGYRPIYDFAQLGILSGFGCVGFAVCAMIYRFQNQLPVTSTGSDDGCTEADS